MIVERRDGEVSVVCDACGGRHRRKYPNRNDTMMALCVGGSLYEAGWRHHVWSLSWPVDLEAVRCPTCMTDGRDPRWVLMPGRNGQ